MSIADLLATIRRFDKNAEVIFDEQEPIGTATDLVLRKRVRRQKTPSARESLRGDSKSTLSA
jgi:hypothetical protein